ncbi:hypothetical protein BGZ94_002366 [Podila epigama]|nr:hypothetical protein BGZ94_002366 [Podila epigama]
MAGKIFDGYSAWFPPELEEHKADWVKGGGSVKELAEADIAFVSDAITSVGQDIRRERRLSLARYKRVFKALEDFNSDSLSDDDLVEGMAAFKSTKTLSLTPKSAPPNQPEPEIQDLTVTEESSAASMTQAIEERANESTRRSSPTCGSHDSGASVQALEPLAHITTSKGGGQKKATSDSRPGNSASRPTIHIVPSPSPQQRPGTAKKRRLPESVHRVTRPAPLTRDKSMAVSVFESSPELEDDPPRMQPQSSEKVSGPVVEQPQRLESRMSVNAYLARLSARLEPGRYARAEEEARTIDISSKDIRLRRKNSAGKRQPLSPLVEPRNPKEHPLTALKNALE